jgi:hypothetical protein
MTGWQINADAIRDPGGTIVATIVPDLDSIRRQELIRRLIFAPNSAYRRGFDDCQRDPDGICDVPDDL